MNLCVFVRRMIKNWTKIDEYSVCLWTCDFFFSARNWLFFRVCVCLLCCEGVLVCWVRNFMYSLAGNSARVRISFVFVYYRYDFLYWKKTRKNSHLLSFKCFWRSQFYSKVVLVFVSVCFLLSQLLSVCCGRRADLQAVLSVVPRGVTSAVKILDF